MVTIADVIDSVEALDLPRGLENSLLKKLTNAQRNADADKLNGACGKLGAFINQVKGRAARRSDAEDAEELIRGRGGARVARLRIGRTATPQRSGPSRGPLVVLDPRDHGRGRRGVGEGRLTRAVEAGSSFRSAA